VIDARSLRGADTVEEKGRGYDAGKKVAGRRRRIVADLTACKHPSGTSGGAKVTGGMLRQMSFPYYGDASEAFAVSFTIQGTTYGEDLLVVRKGGIVMGISEGDLLPVNLNQFQGFVNKAIKKLG
jgi:hypothetical protein